MATKDIVRREVAYPGRACELNAFVAEPADDGGRRAVIVVQEWWGLNDHIPDVARRFAREGYFAIAPDLYSRQGHKVATEPNLAAELMAGLKKEDGIADLLTTIGWRREPKPTQSTRLGTIRCCMCAAQSA